MMKLKRWTNQRGWHKNKQGEGSEETLYMIATVRHNFCSSWWRRTTLTSRSAFEGHCNGYRRPYRQSVRTEVFVTDLSQHWMANLNPNLLIYALYHGPITAELSDQQCDNFQSQLYSKPGSSLGTSWRRTSIVRLNCATMLCRRRLHHCIHCVVAKWN